MRVAALYVYPVKACAAVALDEALLDGHGLAHDRRLALRDASGRLLTQRQFPLLAAVRPELGPQGWQVDLQAIARLAGAPVQLVQADAGFADAAAVLVTASAALAALNRRLAAPVAMARFRPNIVLDGEGGCDERAWRTLRAPGVTLACVAPCERCEVTTIEQASGARRGPEPLRTIRAQLDGSFGIYCRVARPGRLARGEDLVPDRE